MSFPVLSSPDSCCTLSLWELTTEPPKLPDPFCCIDVFLKVELFAEEHFAAGRDPFLHSKPGEAMGEWREDGLGDAALPCRRSRGLRLVVLLGFMILIFRC